MALRRGKKHEGKGDVKGLNQTVKPKVANVPIASQPLPATGSIPTSTTQLHATPVMVPSSSDGQSQSEDPVSSFTTDDIQALLANVRVPAANRDSNAINGDDTDDRDSDNETSMTSRMPPGRGWRLGDITTNHQYWLWVVVCAFALHTFDEYAGGWVAYAQKINTGTPNSPSALQAMVRGNEKLFMTFSVAQLIMFYCMAQIGWHIPELSLSAPALLAMHSLSLHLWPLVRFGTRVPGLVTSLLVCMPVSLLTFRGAFHDFVLDMRALTISSLIAIFMCFFPPLLVAFKKTLYPL